jgi:hypothetical protein
MECISCEQADVFNRVVRNQIRGENLGLFCEECEAEAFGNLLENATWHQDNGCAFCDGTGKYQLPKLECLIESETGEPIDLEFSTFEYTVCLCRTHLKELLPSDTILEDIISDQIESGTVEA